MGVLFERQTKWKISKMWKYLLMTSKDFTKVQDIIILLQESNNIVVRYDDIFWRIGITAGIQRIYNQQKSECWRYDDVSFHYKFELVVPINDCSKLPVIFNF